MYSRIIKWKDKKRILGIPITFTNYSLSMDRLFVESGILVRKEEQVLLYRIRDVTTEVSLWQRLFKVGTVKLLTMDKSTPSIILKNVKTPKLVSEMIFESIEKMKKEQGIKIGEMLESSDVEFDILDI